MQFYTINNLNFESPNIVSSGIDFNRMSKAMIKISTDYPMLDDIAKFILIFVESPVKIITPPDIAKQYKIDKKTMLAVVPFNNPFTIQNGLQQKTFIGNKLSFKSIESLQSPEVGMPDKMTAQEMLALNWLKDERTGISSKTMCFHLFPQIKAYYDANITSKFNFDPDVPYDNGDFKRCVMFSEYVHLLPEQLKEVALINSKWEKIIENWDMLTALVNTGNEQDSIKSYEIIQKCITTPRKNKP